MATKKAAAKKAATPTKRTAAKRTAATSSAPRANPAAKRNPKALNPAIAEQRKAAAESMYASDGYPIFDQETGESRRQYLARVAAETPKVDVKAELKKAAAEETASSSS